MCSLDMLLVFVGQLSLSLQDASRPGRRCSCQAAQHFWRTPKAGLCLVISCRLRASQNGRQCSHGALLGVFTLHDLSQDTWHWVCC